MKRLLFVLFLIWICGYSSSAGDSIVGEYRKPNFGIYLAEGGASFIVGNAVSCGTFLVLSTGYESPGGTHTPHWSILLYPVIYPFASALGVDVTARIFKCRGSFWGAVGGGLLGLGLGWFSVIHLEQGAQSTVAWGLMGALPPILSTVGYNLFQKDNVEQSNLLLHRKYIVAQSYSIEDIAIKRSPKVSIKIIEIEF